MKSWYILRKNGDKKEIIAEAYELEYHDEYMGESFLNITFNSDKPINFKHGDYVEYRGEFFYLANIPACKQQSSNGSYGKAFVYENVKFSSVINELASCDFLDVVPKDNNFHWTSLPNFTFYCNNVTDLADRIQANLDRVYGIGKWNINVETYKQYDEEISIDKQSVWDALCLVDSKFHSNFIIRGRNITIGTYGDSIAHTFKYGVGNGLISLERNIDDSQKVITRLRAYGNTTNIPDGLYEYESMYAVANFKFNIDESHPYERIDILKLYDSDYGYISKIYKGVIDKDGDGHLFHSWTEYKNSYYHLGEGSLLNSNGYYFYKYYYITVEYDIKTEHIPGTNEDRVVSSKEVDAIVYTEKVDDVEYIVWEVNEPKNSYPYFQNYARKKKDSNEYLTVRAHGSATINFPDLVKNHDDVVQLNDYPSGMAVKRLMLPFFPSVKKQEMDLGEIKEDYKGYKLVCENNDVYIDSPQKETLGIVEGTVFVDGTDNEVTREDIYPSLEKMTATDLKNAGVSVDVASVRGDALDEIAISNWAIDGSSELDSGNEVYDKPSAQCYIAIKDIGFDINEYLTTDSAQICMKSGMCVGRTFDIVSCIRKKDATYGDIIYQLTISRKKDEGDNTATISYPNKDFPIKKGDKFVLLGIRMPNVYIKAAAQRLLKAAALFFVNNDKTRFSYTPTIDNLWMAREHRKKKAEGKESESIYSTIHAGDWMMVESENLGISNNVRISNLTIKENAQSPIPEFEVQLQDKKNVGTIQRIINKVDGKDGEYTGGGGLSYDQVKTVISENGKYKFLSKRDDDFAEGQITLEKGVVTQSSHNGSETAADGLIEYFKES